MYSFYGGKPGNPFVIVANFESINAMKEAFRQGSSYDKVHYDEYVIINTINKNDKDNGKIFRRGYNYQNDMGGAEYIAQIVGPGGPAPQVRITSPGNVEGMSTGDQDDNFSQVTASVENSNLIPGYDPSNSQQPFNDEIVWKCYSVRDIDSQLTTLYIGFIMPYLVVDFETKSISPYDSRGRYTGNPTIEKMNASDGQEHPFYKKWKIGIPKGIKGDSVSDLKIVDVTDPDTTKNVTHLYYNYTTYQQDKTHTGEGQPGNIRGKTSTVDLGVFNTITNVGLDDLGTFTISCSNQNLSKEYKNKIKWITDIVKGHYTLDPNTGVPQQFYPQDGELTFVFNTGKYPITVGLNEITDVNLSENGTLTFTMSSRDEEGMAVAKSFYKAISWIDSMDLGADGTLYARYNTDEDGAEPHPVGTNKIQWINNANLTEDGDLNITYNTLDNYNNVNVQTVNSSKIKWINDISVNNGVMTVQYNTPDPSSSSLSTSVKEIQTFGFNIPTAITAPNPQDTDYNQYQIKVKWANNSESILGKYPNSIEDVALDSAGNLLMEFTDPLKQGNSVYNNKNKWKFIGNIGNLKSILVSQNDSTINLSNLTTQGILKKENSQTKLIFKVITSKLIPSGTQVTIVNAGQINYSIDTSLNYSVTYSDASVTSTVFGLDFIFTLSGSNIPTFSGNEALVNILISNLNIRVNLSQESIEEATIDWEQRISSLENCQPNNSSNEESLIVQKANKIVKPNQNYQTGLTEETHGGTDIVTALANLKSQLNGNEQLLPSLTNEEGYAGIANSTNIYTALSKLEEAISTVKSALGFDQDIDSIYYQNKTGEGKTNTSTLSDVINILTSRIVPNGAIGVTNPSGNTPYFPKLTTDTFGGENMVDALQNLNSRVNSLLRDKYVVTYHKVAWESKGPNQAIMTYADYQSNGTSYRIDQPDMKLIYQKNGKDVTKNFSRLATIPINNGDYKPIGIVGYHGGFSSKFYPIRLGLFNTSGAIPTQGNMTADNAVLDGMVNASSLCTDTKEINGVLHRRVEINFYGRTTSAIGSSGEDIAMSFYILWEKLPEGESMPVSKQNTTWLHTTANGT